MPKIKIYITPKHGILDPQGKAVEGALHSLGYKNVSHLQVGKYVELNLDEIKGTDLEEQIKEMCKKLLANPIIEDYRFEVA
jgi:phosphoribosylformylglycinamidine synthase